MNRPGSKRLVVLLNRAAGVPAREQGGERVREIRLALEGSGATAEVREVPGSKLGEAAKESVGQGADVVVAAGGDGTFSAVAGALVGTGVAMGVLPTGTLNHFAKDLGIPGELEAAARVIAHGRVALVDVGVVNERVFINNSSIGIYPHVVRQRDAIRERLGHGKWVAMFHALLALFRRFPVLRLRLVANGEMWLRATPFVFVGNNKYHLDLFTLGQRTRLDAGELCGYFSRHSGRTAMLRLALKALVGRLSQDRDFDALTATELFIDARPRALQVACDGEVYTMVPPLHYRIWPGGLRVMVGEARHGGA